MADTTNTEQTATSDSKKDPFRSWDSFTDEKKSTFDPELWLRLEDGPNILRVVTEGAYEYQAHQFKENQSNPKDRGRKVKCSGVFKWDRQNRKMVYQDGTCPCCDYEILANEKHKPEPRSRWVFGVWHYKANRYKILDVKYGVFGGMKDLPKQLDDNGNPRGTPTGYDLVITFNKNEVPALMYRVSTGKRGPLPAEVMAKVEAQLDTNYLENLIKKPTYEQVLAKMKFIRPTFEAEVAALKAQHGNLGTLGNVISTVKAEAPTSADDFQDYGSADNEKDIPF